MSLVPSFLSRFCFRCKVEKPIKGGAFTSAGKRFLCKDCRPPPAKPERAAA